MFIIPLSEREVIKATKSAEKCYKDQIKEYKYKNETLIELLEITEEEQQQLLTIISKDEYKRRKRIRNKNSYDSSKAKEKYQDQLKAQGKLTKKEEVELRRQKIKDLLAQGLTQKDICTTMNISKITYIRDRKYLKEQGLI